MNAMIFGSYLRRSPLPMMIACRLPGVTVRPVHSPRRKSCDRSESAIADCKITLATAAHQGQLHRTTLNEESTIVGMGAAISRLGFAWLASAATRHSLYHKAGYLPEEISTFDGTVLQREFARRFAKATREAQSHDA